MFMETPRSKRKLIQHIRKLKSDTECADCRHKYHYAVMQFDHIGEKTDNINSMIWRTSMANVLEEIKNCDIVCANCHAMRTYYRQHGLLANSMVE